jgi:hypothetical protein
MRSSELSGGSDLDGTVSGCDAVDVGSFCHWDDRLDGTGRLLGHLADRRSSVEATSASAMTTTTQPIT